ncbi:MAG: cation:proton antiporter, partial [Pseudomonadota bacterium]
MEHGTHAATGALLLLAVAVFAVGAARAVRVSPILGYLIAGVAFGPTGFALIEDVDAMAEVAEYGVVFLLFTIGLELPLRRLRAMRRYVFGLGMAQVAVCGLVIGGIAAAFGLPFEAAFIIGGALALSSTAMVVQLLVERGELQSRAGRGAFGILLAQDIVVAPQLAAAGLLAGGAMLSGEDLAWKAATAAVAIAGMITFSRTLLRPMLRRAAAADAPDLFTAIALLLVLGAAIGAEAAGVSAAMGAFLAGLMLADTEFKHQLDADLRPFRGLLLGLFFLSVGMQLDLRQVADSPLTVVGIAVGLIAIKAPLNAGLARLFGLPAGSAAQCGLTTAQGGEFAFVLFAVGAAALPGETGSLLSAAVILTMVATPALAALGGWAAHRIDATADTTQTATPAHDPDHHHGFVLICGYGRVGQTIARIVEAANGRWVALDMSPGRIAKARAVDAPVHFGDATRADGLRSIGVGRDAVAAVTLDAPETTLQA